MLLRPNYTVEARNQGRCSICSCNLRPLESTDHNGPHERVIDTQAFVDMEGVIYICESCVKEMARMIGFVPQEYVSLAENDVLTWQDKAQELEAALILKQEVVNILTLELTSTAHKTATAYAKGYDEAKEVDVEPDFAGS